MGSGKIPTRENPTAEKSAGRLAFSEGSRYARTMRTIRCICVAFALVPGAVRAAAADNQLVGGVDVSRWRGFNLTEKFTVGKNAPFVEDDFRWIAELGFNFARLPMDYRCYTEKGDWLKFREEMLREIDQAVAFGEKHGIHVCLNLHRAPGFCINPPEEPTNLWTDEATLEVFAQHWRMFARRYKGVPSARLSFNLLNEPSRTTREDYLKVFCRTIEAIQEVDPGRLIVVDGLNVGKEPIPEFLAYSNVVQATRGYSPGQISHYRASWAKGSDKWPEPTWPMPRIIGTLYGPVKPDLRSPLVVRGVLKAGTEIELKVAMVSGKASMVAKTGGRVVAGRVFDPTAEPGAWKPVRSGKYTHHEPAAPLAFKVALPADADEFLVENIDGDWFRFAQISVRCPGGPARVYGTDTAYGKKQEELRLDAAGRVVPPPGVEPDEQLAEYLAPWIEIAGKGESVFVGEWGCYNRTPHPVVLDWMKCWLERWKRARFGWALWNFRGSFGILDSERPDVAYEDWHGHKLDRKMLELLQQYREY